MPYSAGVFFLVMKLKPPKIIRHLFPSLIWEIDDPEGVFLTFDDGILIDLAPLIRENAPKTFRYFVPRGTLIQSRISRSLFLIALYTCFIQ